VLEAGSDTEEERSEISKRQTRKQEQVPNGSNSGNAETGSTGF